MATILDTILSEKKIEVDQLKMNQTRLDLKITIHRVHSYQFLKKQISYRLFLNSNGLVHQRER